MSRVRAFTVLSILVCLALQPPASGAVCVNRFLAHAEGARQVVTLLTGKLTFQEAQTLAHDHGAVEWVDDNGKVVAVCTELRPLRPMPVGCDGKTSGVVMQATFMTMRQPAKKMIVKLGDAGSVEFQEQG